jgi:hypothetical protein
MPGHSISDDVANASFWDCRVSPRPYLDDHYTANRPHSQIGAGLLAMTKGRKEKVEGSAAATMKPSTFHITCYLEVFVQSVMLFFLLAFFLLAFFLLSHSLLPPYGIPKIV